MTDGAEKRYFVCRLMGGPRPTFPFDITPEERLMMQSHSQYWKRHMDAGRVVVFGPVLDPKGVWGLGVMRARDEAELREMQEADPAILAQCGFSYETLPMMTAVVPTT